MDRIDSNINWDDVIKKEARGLDDEDLGEVHEVGPDYVLTQKGALHKHKYKLPKNLVTRFDGNKLWFKITKDEVDRYKSVHDGEVLDNTVADDTIYNKSDIDGNNVISGTSNDTYSNINWDDVIKKEARGLDDEDLGEVHEVGPDYVLTQKGALHKHKYKLPKNLVTRFDGNKLWFKITKDEVDRYKSVHDGEVLDNTVADDTIYNKSDIDGNNVISGTSNDTYSNINWDDVIKKEARGLDDEDLGEVHEVGPDYVLTQKGALHKHKYKLPRNYAVKFDGNKLWFKITKDEVDRYKTEF